MNNPLSRVKKPELPRIGQRILKTTLAVFLCMIIHMAAGGRTLLTEAAVAAIICVQPYRKESRYVSVNRVYGTIMGVFWAVAFMLLIYGFPALQNNLPLVYFIMAVGTMLTIYSSIVIHQSDNAALAAIIYICIVGAYPNITDPVMSMVLKLIYTLEGIAIAGLVNSIRLPRKTHRDYLFFIRMQDLASKQISPLSSSVLVLINHLLGDGARLCLTSVWAPAFMIGQVGFLNLRLPVVVMDGVALYDIVKASYLNVIPIERNSARMLMDLLDRWGMGYRVFTLRGHNMMVYSYGLSNDAERDDDRQMMRSPYRNYMPGDMGEEDDICVIRFLNTVDKIDEYYNLLEEKIGEMGLRMVKRSSPISERYAGIYFYNDKATMERQQTEVLRIVSEQEGTTMKRVIVLPRRAYRKEEDAIALLSKVRNQYEPIWLPLIGELKTPSFIKKLTGK